MTKLIYKVPAPDPAKKGSHHHSGKYQQQEANKDQKGINCEKDLYKTVYITHIIEANVARIYCL